MPGLTLSRKKNESVALRNAATGELIIVTVVRVTDGIARVQFQAGLGWDIFRTEREAEWEHRSQHDGPLETDGGPVGVPDVASTQVGHCPDLAVLGITATTVIQGDLL